MIDDFKEKYGNNDINKTIKTKLFNFININGNPTEEDINDFAIRNGYELKEIIPTLCKIIIELTSGVGKHKNVPNDKFDQMQLSVGTRIEHEHTDSDLIAAEIAKDHLSENEVLSKSYYTRLVRMEREAEKE